MSLFPRRAAPLDDAELLDAPPPERTAVAPRRRPTRAPVSPADAALPPSELRANEAQIGYVVAAVIAVVAVLDLAITHGAGAPAHPNRFLPAIGLALALTQAATIRRRHRLLTGLLGVAAAFCVSYVKVPNSLALPHFAGLLLPVIYAFVLTQRHSKAQKALQGTGSRGRQAAGRSRGKGKEPEVPKGPAPNRRYTPPKPRDERRERRR